MTEASTDVDKARDAHTGRGLLEVRGISKTFPGQVALDSVDLTLRAGEVLALAGANGSGKSTLIKILAGYHEADPGGEITVFGERLWPDGDASLRHRLHFVHQDLGLIPTLSVADNLALVCGYSTGALARIRWREQRRRTRALVGRFGADIDVRLPVASLSPTERTIVAIARALDGWGDDVGVLVVDEPTAALHRNEVEKLFAAIREVTSRGSGVLFVSHRTQEVLDFADRVVVLRDGRVVADDPTSGLGSDRLVEVIAGRQIEDSYGGSHSPGDTVVMSVDGLSGEQLQGLTFDVHSGEMLGITGLLGSGHDELPGLLFGTNKRGDGSITIAGRTLDVGHPRQTIRQGLVMVPADRVRQSLVMSLSVRENVTLPNLQPLWRRLSRGRERREVRALIERFAVTPPDPERPVAVLSGGNQQKTVLAKWLRTMPQVIVLAEPTAGVDVGAKSVIYELLIQAAADGLGVILCSTDAKELASVCDRVLVLRDGVVAAQLQGGSLTEGHIVSESLASAT